MIKITKIYDTNYQRNGSGEAEGFYSALVNWEEDDVSFSNFLITFETDSNDEKIQEVNIRVVDLSNLKTCWRGDGFVEPLQKYLKKKVKTNIHDFMKYGENA